MRVAEGVAEEGAQHGCETVEGQEDAHSERLLGACVEHAYDHHDGGGYAGFEHAEEKADCEDAGVVLERDVAAQEDGPGQDHAARVFGDGQALDQVVGGKGPEEVAEVEDGGRPAVALPLEAEVWD